MKALTEQARELGATTRFTAGEVASLQKEFAKLGFDQTEIKNMTEATLSLAAATGTELAEAAAVAGGVMNAFGLDSSQTQRAVDVMAASFSKSALDMEKFKETMKTAAPIAKATGVSLEQATAAAGKLADANISGSKAGTDLKKIFSELVKDGKPLEESLNDIAAELDKASTKAEKLAIAEDLVDDRAKGALLILVEQREALAELEDGLENSGGAAKDMADKQLNTLNGALDLLKSAWEGFILDLNEGTGAFAGLKDILFFVANNLNSIIKVIKAVALGWGAYKLALSLVNKETGKFIGLGLAQKISSLGKTLSLMTKGTRGAALGFKRMGVAMKSIPFVAWVSGITTVVSLLWDFVGVTEEAISVQERLNNAAEKGRTAGNKTLMDIRERITEEERLIDIRERSNEITKEEGVAERISNIDREIALIEKLNEEVQKKLDKKVISLGGGIGITDAAITQARIEAAENKAQLIEQMTALTELKHQKDEYLTVTKEITKENKSTTKEFTKQTKVLTGLDKLKKELSDIRKLRSDELVINGETVLFQRYTNQTKELTTQIELLEARLELSEEGFNAKSKKVITDISEITGEGDLREEANKAVDDFVNIQVEGAEEVADNDKKYYEQRLTALKQFAAKAIEIANAKTDKEIENVDKELSANKKRQDELQQLAAQGNLTAEQSVSAEIKRELELERQKEALEKKKARRQIILEGLDLLSSKIDGGEKDAVTSTLNDMTRLLGALAALPGFIDGTETTVGAALGKPQLNTGTDDYIVRVDGSEKILNPGMSARTGNMTTEEITRAAEMYSSGMFDQNLLIHPQVAALNQPFQNSNEILKKFDSLESTIRNKPILSDLKFDDLQKALVVTVEQNGDLKRAHYKLK
jgi:hypothetical protein